MPAPERGASVQKVVRHSPRYVSILVEAHYRSRFQDLAPSRYIKSSKSRINVVEAIHVDQPGGLGPPLLFLVELRTLAFWCTALE